MRKRTVISLAAGTATVGGATLAYASLVERNLNRWTIAFALLFVANVIILLKI